MRKYKWHILVLVGAIFAGKTIPKLNSKAMEGYCQKIINVVSKPGKSAIEPYLEAVKIMESTKGINDDSLKNKL